MRGIFAALVLSVVFIAWNRDSIADWASARFGVRQENAASTASQSQSQYITAPIEVGELRRVVTATGTLSATVNIEVGSQLSGQIAELFVDFNDEVKKGQPLARLDQQTFEARVAEGKAAVEMAEVAVTVARTRLDKARVDALDSEAQRAVLKARIDNAQAKGQSARKDLKRKETLREKQISSLVEVDDAQTKSASAEAALREAEAIAAAHENEIAASKAELARAAAELDMAIATVQQKKAQLRISEIDLDRATIRSPIDGIVVARKVNEGQTLATTLEAKTLFIIAGDLRQMEIHARLDEADIGKVKVGQDAVFSVDAYPGQQFDAVVRQIRADAEVQQNVVTYTVVLSAPNPDNRLLPGMTTLTRITVHRAATALVIPLAGLRYSPKSARAAAGAVGASGGRAATAWLVDGNGQPRAVTIGIGEEDASHAAIVSGALSVGDRVIIGETASTNARQIFGIRIGF